MAANVDLIHAAVALVVIVGPLLFALLGWVRARGEPQAAHPSWNWTLTIASALLYVLAFNVTFFIQELFLVLPKALTPGLRPTLFHNNHSWQGEHPLASLFQGTGALATVIVAIVCVMLLRQGAVRAPTVRLFLIWLAYNGFFQALPQVVIGAMNPRNDVGMAMDYFGLTLTAKTVAAFAALFAMPLVAAVLARSFLTIASSPAEIATAKARTRFIFLAATLPALVAIVPILPFRMPRDWIEVALLPVIVTVTGIVWVQASAWRVSAETVSGTSSRWPVGRLLAAAAILLALFQLGLRPGIRFF